MTASPESRPLVWHWVASPINARGPSAAIQVATSAVKVPPTTPWSCKHASGSDAAVLPMLRDPRARPQVAVKGTSKSPFVRARSRHAVGRTVGQIDGTAVVVGTQVGPVVVEDAEVEDAEVEDGEVGDAELEDAELEDAELEDAELEDAEAEDGEDEAL
ncbi:hypothetical protein G6O67_004617 [Ophiocordyceps sinensis]|uniref:Uncharacterized protein n=1 Tax=Ophiocordyceps sinensis TaxID=72228 RepID=A0A8H4PPT0_9HYPO|nr:hypothetical protein G6O67_004617 [Ophiocordyceps sinensis]